MISSVANSKIKQVVLLREKSRERDKDGVFVAEGRKLFLEVPAEKVRELYIEETLPEKEMEKVEACRKAGVFVETVSSDVMKKLSDTKTPQGVVMVVTQPAYQLQELIQSATKKREKGGRPLFLLLEDIQDPGNLGTMIRTGEGAGVDGIIMTRNTVDIFNPKTIRSTMGSLFRVPFVYVDSIEAAIKSLQKNEIHVYAAHLKGEKFYHEIDYQSGSAFLIGNEGNGLKKETADLADSYLKIPMEGKLESLNAAVAAALLMYQSRQ